MPTRRRIDHVLEAEFLSDLDALDLDALRERRQMAVDVENELSYYRRLLHGRTDLLRFEQRRRSGEEDRDLIDALAEILADPATGQEPKGRHIVTDLPPLPDVGKRDIDYVLGDDVLTKLDEIDDDEIDEALVAIAEIEQEISEQRKLVQSVVDRLSAEIGDRYRAVGS